MSSSSEVPPHLRRSVVTIESTIPPDMTIAEWRRLLASRQPAKRRHRPLGLGRRGNVVELARASADDETDPCGHLHETTTRYDHERKLLTFLAVCRSCGTERVVETRHYEPRHERAQPMRRAA
jgi:hypothetical protein